MEPRDSRLDALKPISDRIPPEWRPTIAIQAGWDPIVITLDQQLAEISPDYEVHQVKEKFGGLRYYYGLSEQARQDPTIAPRMDALIRQAEALAGRTCEECGEPGTLIKGAYLRTLCPTCEAARAAARGAVIAPDADQASDPNRPAPEEMVRLAEEQLGKPTTVAEAEFLYNQGLL